MLGHCTKVLVVEDDPIIALMTAAIVEDLGYWLVGPIHRLAPAVAIAREEDIDFALLDFELGEGTDALPIVEVLSQRHIGFAIATGKSADEVHEVLPGCRVIGKPVVESELEAILP